jgi:hypothetical protein
MLEGIQDDLTGHDRKSQGQEGGLAPVDWGTIYFRRIGYGLMLVPSQ